MPAELDELWTAVSEELRTSFPPSTYERWFAPLRAVSSGETTLLVAAPDRCRTWVERRYADVLLTAVRRRAPAVTQVTFVDTDAAPASRTDGAPSARGVALDPKYAFEQFVIGEGNRFAHAAALAVAEAPAQAYNPLFLHGPPGLGKTHLIGAIADYLRQRAPGLRVRYTTAETFTNDFVGALQTGEADRFKEAVRGADVLLVDDIQFLQGKPRTEEEFFHTFNALYEGGSQIVLAGDRSPDELSDLAQRLRDRFEWGLVAEVGPPDPRTRLTVLRTLAERQGLSLESSVLAAIAELVTTNVRRLEGALTRVVARSSLTGRVIDLELVRETLAGAAAIAEPGPPSVDRIREVTAAALDVEEEAMTGSSRATNAVYARQIAMYLGREVGSIGLSELGAAFGGRDHSTVHHSVKRISTRMSTDASTAQLIDRLTAQLRLPHAS